MFVHAYNPENSVYEEKQFRALKRMKGTSLPLSPDIVKATREMIINRTADDITKADLNANTISLRTSIINKAVVRMAQFGERAVFTVKCIYNGFLNIDKNARRDINGNIAPSLDDIEYGSFSPESAASSYVSRDLTSNTSVVYRPTLLDVANLSYLRKINPCYNPVQRVFSSTFNAYEGCQLENIVRTRTFPTNELARRGFLEPHKPYIEMAIPEPQFFTPIHSFMHTRKFVMDDVVSVPVLGRLVDDTTKISVLDNSKQNIGTKFFDRYDNEIFPEDSLHYRTTVRQSIEEALVPVIEEFLRHQTKSMWVSYDSDRLLVNIDKVEYTFAVAPNDDLNNSLVTRLVGPSRDVRYRFEDHLENIRAIYGAFTLNCHLSDTLITVRLNFAKELSKRSGIKRIDITSSIHDIVSFTNGFMIDVNNPIKFI